MSWGVGRRHNLDPAWLWLWCRPAATGLIGPLAWEPPHAAGAALKRQDKRKKRKERRGKEKRERKEGSSCCGTKDLSRPAMLGHRFHPQPAQWVKGSSLSHSCGLDLTAVCHKAAKKRKKQNKNKNPERPCFWAGHMPLSGHASHAPQTQAMITGANG